MEVYYRKSNFKKVRIPRKIKWERNSFFIRMLFRLFNKVFWDWTWKTDIASSREVPEVIIFKGFKQIGSIRYSPNESLSLAPAAAKNTRLDFSSKYTLFLSGTVLIYKAESLIKKIELIPFDPHLGFIFPGYHGDVAISKILQKDF